VNVRGQKLGEEWVAAAEAGGPMPRSFWGRLANAGCSRARQADQRTLDFQDLFGEDSAGWPTSLRAAVDSVSPATVLVRLWCAKHPGVLVAAVFATPNGGPLLVDRNVPRRHDPHGWRPVPTEIEDQPQPLYCNKCRAPRTVEGLLGAVRNAQATRPLNLRM